MVGLDGVCDAIGEQFVLLYPRVFLEVVGDTRRDGLDRDLLAALARKENEWKVGGGLSYCG